MAPQWLTVVAWCAIAVGVLSGTLIAVDVFGRGYRQHMAVMDIVWPVSGLYLGPLALLGYAVWGRPQSARWEKEHGPAPERPYPATVALGVTHCGAGCSIGDFVGGWLVLLLALEIAGRALFAEFVVNFSLAFAFGIAFQYFAIVPMRGLGRRDGLVAALKADSASLTAFEVGMFGWMAVVQLVFFADPHLTADSASYWFMMQIAMVLGSATAYPVNWWLIRSGIKEAM